MQRNAWIGWIVVGLSGALLVTIPPARSAPVGGTRSARTFCPSGISGLFLWSARSGAEGSPVTSVTDSGSGATLQAVADSSTAPVLRNAGINGWPSWEFDGSTSQLRVPHFFDQHPEFNSGVEIFVAAQTADPNLRLAACAGNGAGFLAYFGNELDAYAANLAGAGLQQPRVNLSVDHTFLMHMRYNGSSFTGEVNGRSSAGPASGNLGFGGDLLIGAYSGGGYHWRGQIQAVCITPPLSSAQRSSLERFLSRPCGLSAHKRLVVDGDSFEEGYGVTPDQRWSNRLQSALGPGWEQVNLAFGSFTTEYLQSRAEEQVDVLSAPAMGENLLIAHEGMNSIRPASMGGADDDGPTAAGRMRQYLQTRRAAGQFTETFTYTLIPCIPSIGGPQFAQRAVAYNAALASYYPLSTRDPLIWTDGNGNYLGRADLLPAFNTFDGPNASYLNPQYYQADGTHPNCAGHQLLASLALWMVRLTDDSVPASIPDLHLWSAQFGTDGSPVTSVSDLSSTGPIAAVADSTTAPLLRPTGLNGCPSWEFNGSTSQFRVPHFFDQHPEFNSGMEIFVVAQTADPDLRLAVCAGNGAGFLAHFANKGDAFAANLSGANVQQPSGNSTLDQTFLLQLRYDGSTFAGAINGRTGTGAASGSMGWSGDLLIGAYSGGGYHWLGQIQSVCITPPLTSQQRSGLTAYLAAPSGLVHRRRFVVDGDSFEQGYGVALEQRWTNGLQSALGPDWEQVNCGVNGQTTEQMAARAQQEVDILSAPIMASDFLFAHEGTNAMLPVSSGGSDDDGPTAATRLWQYLQDRRASGQFAATFALTVTPRSPSSGGPSWAQRAVAYNSALAANYPFRTSDPLVWTDGNGNYLGRVDLLPAFNTFDGPNASYLNPQYYQADGTHPNAAGHAEITRVACSMAQLEGW